MTSHRGSESLRSFAFDFEFCFLYAAMNRTRYYPELKIEPMDLATMSGITGENPPPRPPLLPPRTTSVPINLSFLFHYRNDVTARFIKLFRGIRNFN